MASPATTPLGGVAAGPYRGPRGCMLVQWTGLAPVDTSRAKGSGGSAYLWQRQVRSAGQGVALVATGRWGNRGCAGVPWALLVES
jgi:hypothetical protein